ncbi:3-keto-5-aminohexanoate cleavage protein [Pseudomonas putida]|uniref:3-keto-5-aminohexanoate cleavage protein n=1 Tax=Pseudomonas putida TaxID=303 RepID=UPI0009BA3EFF
MSRLGLEDNLYLNRRQFSLENASLVERAVRIIHQMWQEVATPEQARNILQSR